MSDFESIPANQRSQTTILVRSYDLDSFGHVNNAVYLNYLEAARCDFMLDRGMSFNSFFDRNVFPVLVRAEIDFRAPAKCDDTLIIRSGVSDWQSRTFTMLYSVSKRPQHDDDAEVDVINARTIHVFIDQRGRAIHIPEWFKKAMNQAPAAKDFQGTRHPS